MVLVNVDPASSQKLTGSIQIRHVSNGFISST